MGASFEPWERKVLTICQGNLPDSPTPYADIAAACGVSEAQVIQLLQRLKQSGAIRRFGATLRHQRVGWAYNAMVAWEATPEEAEKWAPLAAANSRISHIYFRPSPNPHWPYTLYTMVHGRDEREGQTVIAKLAQSWPLRNYAVLRSIRELKKTSMIYFD